MIGLEQLDNLLEPGSRFTFTNEPTEYTLGDYSAARELLVNYYSAFRDVLAIYEYGSLSAPGLSDLDIILVLPDEVAGLTAEQVQTGSHLVQKRLETFRNSGDLVIYLQDSHDEGDKEFERFPSHCVSGTWGNEIIPQLAPKPGEEVVTKKRFSGFYGTDLESILDSAEVDGVEVVGVCTSICVMDTSGGLANRDYKITVPVKGVADFDQEFHEFSLKRMQQVYGASLS